MFIDKKELGLFICEKRHLAGVSQAHLAQKLGYKTPQYISNWERGSSVPPLRKMLPLANHLRIPLKELIFAIVVATESRLKTEFSSKSKKNLRKRSR